MSAASGQTPDIAGLPRSTGRMPETRRSPWWVYGGVALAAALVYLNSLGNGFTYDDIPIMLENPATAAQAPWSAPWTRPYWPGSEKYAEMDVLYRPLTVATYAVQRRFTGDNPLPFHAVNVLLHAAVSAGVCWLARRLGCGAGAAALAGVVFAVHPIHTEAVANVVGRAELISAVGTILALWATDRWWQRVQGSGFRVQGSGFGGFRSVWIAWLGILVGTLVAVAGKESGAATAAIVIAWAAWRARAAGFSPREAPISTSRSLENSAGGSRDDRAALERTLSLRDWLILAIPLLVLLAAYLVVRYEVCGLRLTVGGQRVGPGNPLREADAVARVLTPFSLLGHYLALMVWPARLLCDYSLNVMPPTTSPADPYFWIGAGAAAAMIAWAVRSRRGAGAGWLIAFAFAAAYFIASNFVLLIDVIFAERIIYAPSIWVCVMLGLLVQAVVRRSEWAELRPSVRGFVRVGLVAAVLALAGRTWARNGNWADNETLFRHDLAAMTPGFRSAHILSVVAQFDHLAADFDAAEQRLLEAISIYRTDPEFHLLLGEVYLATRRYDQAVEVLEKAKFLKSRSMKILATLERVRRLAAGTNVVEELDTARQNAAERPGDADAARRWALAAEAGDAGEAARAFEHWARLVPDDAGVLKGYAFALAGAERFREAVQTFRRVIELSPDDWEAHTNLAVLLIDRLDPNRYDPEGAVRHARRAVEINPTHWQANVNLAEVLAACGDPSEAAALFERLAAQSAPGSDEQRLYAERARFLRKR